MTSSIRSSASALAIAVALGWPVGSPAATPGNLAATKAAIASAQRAYELGRFEEAIAGYSSAYELNKLPALLFNLAQCHRQLKQYERAAFFYGRYLSLAPAPNENEEIARSLLKEMDAAAAAQQAAQEAAAAPREPEAVVPAEALPLPVMPAPPTVAEPSTPLVKQWWLWTVVGAVVVGGAVATGVLASQGHQAPALTTLDDVHF